MKDWTAIARGNGIEIFPREMDRISEVLESLDAAFRPIVRNLSPELEPAISFHVEDNSE